MWRIGKFDTNEPRAGELEQVRRVLYRLLERGHEAGREDRLAPRVVADVVRALMRFLRGGSGDTYLRRLMIEN